MVRNSLSPFLFVTSILYSTSYAEEFIYPVGFHQQEGRQYCYLIHQVSPKSLHLWEWDLESKEVELALPAPFLPAGFQLLPNNGGFSFIHHGRLYVQQWGKRSPKAVDFYEPLAHFSIIHWISEKSFYFSAECLGFFSLFAADLDGAISCLVSGAEGIDCLYPQKQGDTLFYIRRSCGECGNDKHYEICQTTYGTLVASKEFCENNYGQEDTLALISRIVQTRTHSCVSAPQRCDAQSVALFAKSTQPIVFLTMASQERGFFVSHPASIHAGQWGIPFGYHMLWYEKNAWHERELFSFVIPTRLLLNDTTQSRLFESLYRLLPYECHGCIYFVHCAQQGEGVGLYKYDINNGEVTLLLPGSVEGNSFFAPLFMDNKLIVGGSCTKVTDAQLCGHTDSLSSSCKSTQNWLPYVQLSSGVVSKVDLPRLKV